MTDPNQEWQSVCAVSCAMPWTPYFADSELVLKLIQTYTLHRSQEAIYGWEHLHYNPWILVQRQDWLHGKMPIDAYKHLQVQILREGEARKSNQQGLTNWMGRDQDVEQPLAVDANEAPCDVVLLLAPELYDARPESGKLDLPQERSTWEL